VLANQRPNLLVLLTDDQRVDTLGCYNPQCPIKTPNLDRLAAQGIRFRNGFVTTPICVVSRASILTGRYACNARQHQFQVPMPDDVFEHSYPVYLHQAGYFNGHFGKYGVGITELHKQAFDVFEGQAGQGPPFREYQGRTLHDSEWLTVKTREFLDRVPAGQPFCLQLSYKAPHSSSVPAPEDDHLLDDYDFQRRPMDTAEAHAALPEHVKNGYGRRCYQAFFGSGKGHNPYLRQYFEKIVSVERSVGMIRQMLDERGLAGNTVILFLSDHGTHFGEKQLGGKWTPYEQSLRVPFIVYDPRPQARKGVIRNEMVLNIDVAPTLLELAGVPAPRIMDGRSMVSLIHGRDQAWRDHFFFEHYTSPARTRYIPRNVGVRYVNTKYVRWIDPDIPVEEFFDLKKDTMEANNLIGSRPYQKQVNAARTCFEQWRSENPSPFEYDPYGKRPQFGAKDIDWDRFKEVRPKEYDKIKREVERMGLTWQQALDNWDIRFRICMKVGYWY